jgi:hypothetical protein
MKNKTLLEAATDMLLNRPESVVAEAAPAVNWEKLGAKDLFDTIRKATLALYHNFYDSDMNKSFDEFDRGYSALISAFKKAGLYEASESEEDDEQHDLEEATEVDNIAAKVAELDIHDITNFGVVVALGGNSVTFKAKDLPKTTITFNKRKIGSRDYVLSDLRLIKKAK